MLNDITTITIKIFDEFLRSDKKLNSNKNIYDLFRKLECVIDSTNLVANHYLALDFSEEYLQGSSCGTLQDKWRKFLNYDLETLNQNSKSYLLKLQSISFSNENELEESFLNKLYKSKTFYSFVRDEYNIGFIEPCSYILIQDILSIKSNNDAYYINEFNKINLSTYNQRVELQKILLYQSSILKKKLEELRLYILKNIRLEDLL
jgi:hypothetical protein